MTNRVIDKVMENADQLRELAWEAERIGRLPDETVKTLKSIGVIRLMQPKKYGGFEAHPREFAGDRDGYGSSRPGVRLGQRGRRHPPMAARLCGSDGAGGGIGVPITETWIASPFSPSGVARPVEGGYIFDGRWQFSSGTDHCDWIFLGAMLGDQDGKPVMPPKMLIMTLPRRGL